MTRPPAKGTTTRSSTAEEETGTAGTRRIGILTYVLCYDDLTRGDAFRLPGLGAEKLDLRIGRAASDETTRARGHEVWIRDPLVSRVHARVHYDGTNDVLSDLGSKHGTFVNGARIEQRALEDGDTVEVGHTLLVYRTVDAPTARLLAAQPDATLGPTRTLSPRIVRILHEIERVAPTPLSVLLLGETGTGKDVAARQIHALSRRPGTLLTINCAALAEALIEDELFGHERGAYTGAPRSRPGALRSADGGTVLLDEIGEMPDAAQATLLRVIGHGEVKPVGADRPEEVTLRWLAATNAAVRGPGARLRPDLLGRLGEVILELPPLRERREDLGILAAHILQRCAEIAGRPIPRGIDRHAGRALFCGPLPLNVRGLFDTLKRASLVATGDKIELADLGILAEDGEAPDDAAGEEAAAVAPGPGGSRNKRPERALLVALRERHPTDAAVAAALGVHEKQLRRWLKDHALPSRRRSPK